MASYHFSIKSGKRGKAENHAAYIAREGKHSKGEKKHDLVAKDHGNLPEWANGNPATFWKMADVNERANGAAYRELEIALPSELTKEQNLALVKNLINDLLGDKPFQCAIHAPVASLGKVTQEHVHIMFSDRKPDGIVRSPAQHFKRYNPTNPEQGGCKKDSGGKEKCLLKEELISCRESVARIQNTHLEMNGHAARVDHRSNKDRGIEQAPERHLGHLGIKKLTDEEKEAYKTKREGSRKPKR